MSSMKNQNTDHPDLQEISETRTDKPKFRPVLHALTSNPGVQMMDYAQNKQDMITLAQGEGSEPTPDFIVDAVTSALKDGKTFYGPVLGLQVLREALSGYYKRIYDLDFPYSRFFVTQSGTTAMHLSLAALLDKGDEVVAITPIWKNLLGAIELTQATTRQISLDHDEKGWTLDLDKLFASVNEKTKVILIVSPSNPTGWTASHDEMRAIINFARERGIWVLADEVYSRLVFDGSKRAPSFLDIAKDDDPLLVVNSFSKAWAMTGWRMGWIVGPKMAENKIRDVALYNNLCPQTPMQYGGIAALEQGEDFIKSQLDLWKSNRDLTIERFEKMGRIHMTKPDATFYGFFKVDGEPDCLKLTRRFIDEAGVLLSPGCAFGHSCAGYIRMCFAVSERRLSEALDRIEKIL